MAEQMQAEVYVKEPPPGTDVELQTSFEAHELRVLERAELAEAIGMTALAEQDLSRVHSERALAWCKSRELTPLTADDRAAWEAWLPMPYYSGMSDLEMHMGRVESLSNYRYHEGVPLHIRQLMKEALPIFSKLEIRTPEKQPVVVHDPVLFGHIDFPGRTSEVYALARWGESDSNLITLDEIKAIIRLRTQRFDGEAVFAFGFMGFVLALMSGAIFGGIMEMFSMKTFLLFMLLPGMFGSTAVWMILTAYRRINIFNYKKTNPHLAKMV